MWIAKPMTQKASMPIAYTMKFIVMVWPAFLARVKPVSTIAKPSCMNITRKPATSVQTMFSAAPLSATVLATSSIVGGAAGRLREQHAGAATAARSAPAISPAERVSVPAIPCSLRSDGDWVGES